MPGFKHDTVNQIDYRALLQKMQGDLKTFMDRFEELEDAVGLREKLPDKLGTALAPIPRKVLGVLLKASPRWCTPAYICQVVYLDGEGPLETTIRVHVGRIRTKLPRWHMIQCVEKYGYSISLADKRELESIFGHNQ